MIVLENFLDPYDLFELMRTNYSCKAEVSHRFGLGMHLVCDFRFFDNSNCSYSPIHYCLKNLGMRTHFLGLSLDSRYLTVTCMSELQGYRGEIDMSDNIILPQTVAFNTCTK